MGCNLHAHIEVKKAGQWHHFGQPNVERNYYLFSIITGERVNSKRDNIQSGFLPVAHIHEIPADISYVTKVCLEQDKAAYHIHHSGVLLAEDLPELQDCLYEGQPSVKRTGIDQLDLEYSIFRTYINGGTLTEHRGWDDLRIVFWFDN